MTEDQVRDKVRKLISANGDENVSAVARELKVSVSYLHDFLRGRRAPGKAILRALNMRRVVDYRGQ